MALPAQASTASIHSSDWEGRVDQCVHQLVNGIMLSVRVVLFLIPVVLLGPLVECLTCWRYLVMARGIKFIWTGEVPFDDENQTLIQEGYVLTNGVFCFNVYDLLVLSIFSVAVVLPVAFITIIVDIFTLNKFKVCSRLQHIVHTCPFRSERFNLNPEHLHP